jgi:ribonuclease HII
MTSAQLPLAVSSPPEQMGDVERALAARGISNVMGTDEAGRGPLAGPVTAAAVLIDLRALDWCVGLDDSKRLDAGRRAAWVPVIEANAVAFAVVHVEADAIDRMNILAASLEAMRQACIGCGSAGAAVEVLVDGNRPIPGLPTSQRTLVKGDRRSYAVAAASILAKEARDARLRELDALYPAYGFAQHKGYPTASHLAALAAHGPCPAHRQSYRPVAAALSRSG